MVVFLFLAISNLSGEFVASKKMKEGEECCVRRSHIDKMLLLAVWRANIPKEEEEEE